MEHIYSLYLNAFIPTETAMSLSFRDRFSGSTLNLRSKAMRAALTTRAKPNVISIPADGRLFIKDCGGFEA